MDMESARNVISRLQSVWRAAKEPTEDELARREGAPPEGRRSSQYPMEPIEPSRQLTEFRLLVGIQQDKSFRAATGYDPNQRPVVFSAHRPAPNRGIYPLVCENEIKCKRNFKFCSTLINTCLGLQIVVAAALTALGAANGSHHAVTAFGAINTVIAGFLTYLKGSGLPNRLKYYQHEWSKVREYIESRERDLICSSTLFDVHEVVDKVRTMYEAVRVDVESNTPDRYVGVQNVTRSNMTASSSPNRGSYSEKTTSLAGSDAQRLAYGLKGVAQDRIREVGDLEKGAELMGKDWFHQRQTEVNTALNKAQDVDSHLYGNIRGLKSQFEDDVREVGQLQKNFEAQGRRFVDEKNAALAQVQSTARDIVDTKDQLVLNTKAAGSQEVNAASRAMQQQATAARRGVEDTRESLEQAIRARATAVEQSVSQRQEAVRQATHDDVDKEFDAASGIDPKDAGNR